MSAKSPGIELRAYVRPLLLVLGLVYTVWMGFWIILLLGGTVGGLLINLPGESPFEVSAAIVLVLGAWVVPPALAYGVVRLERARGARDAGLVVRLGGRKFKVAAAVAIVLVPLLLGWYPVLPFSERIV